METKLSDKWTTPEWLIDLFKGYYDPCPLNPIEDGLNTNWKDYTYVNPPYSEPLKWVLKAIEENKKGKTIVLLLKLDSSTRWYKELVNANAHILLFNERLHYSDSNPANFPSMLAILSAPAKPEPAKSDCVCRNKVGTLNHLVSDTGGGFTIIHMDKITDKKD